MGNVIQFARSWTDAYVGIPFVEKGRSHAGCDCWGLVTLVYRERIGIHLPDFSDEYASTKDGEVIGELCRREREGWMMVNPPAEFDVVLLRVRGLPWHVGLCLTEYRMLHVQQDGEAVVESLEDPMWRPKIEGFYRYCGCGAFGPWMFRPA